MFENPRRGRQACARNFTKNVPKILDLKLSSEQKFSEEFNIRKTGWEHQPGALIENIVQNHLIITLLDVF